MKYFLLDQDTRARECCVCRSVFSVQVIFTDLIGEHIAGDLVGNNVRVVGEDIEQDWTMVLP